MFPKGVYGFEGSLSGSPELLYIIKTLHFFEDLVGRSAKEQSVPTEILRVLQPCRGVIILGRNAFFCVLGKPYDGESDEVRTVAAGDFRGQEIDIKEAERICGGARFRHGSQGEPPPLLSSG